MSLTCIQKDGYCNLGLFSHSSTKYPLYKTFIIKTKYFKQLTILLSQQRLRKRIIFAYDKWFYKYINHARELNEKPLSDVFKILRQ